MTGNGGHWWSNVTKAAKPQVTACDEYVSWDEVVRYARKAGIKYFKGRFYVFISIPNLLLNEGLEKQVSGKVETSRYLISL